MTPQPVRTILTPSGLLGAIIATIGKTVSGVTKITNNDQTWNKKKRKEKLLYNKEKKPKQKTGKICSKLRLINYIIFEFADDN